MSIKDGAWRRRDLINLRKSNMWVIPLSILTNPKSNKSSLPLSDRNKIKCRLRTVLFWEGFLFGEVVDVISVVFLNLFQASIAFHIETSQWLVSRFLFEMNHWTEIGERLPYLYYMVLSRLLGDSKSSEIYIEI